MVNSPLDWVSIHYYFQARKQRPHVFLGKVNWHLFCRLDDVLIPAFCPVRKLALQSHVGYSVLNGYYVLGGLHPQSDPGLGWWLGWTHEVG